jgi:hypothetical protein
MKYVVFWVITRRHVVISYRRFGTMYRSHPHGSRFRVGTSVNNHHTMPCNNPEDHRFHQHRGRSLKSRSFYLLVINKVVIMIINTPDKLLINSPSALQNCTCGNGLLSNKFLANGRLQKLPECITLFTRRRK